MKEIEFNVDSYEARVNGDKIALTIYTDCDIVINKFTAVDIVENYEDINELYKQIKIAMKGI
jgi:hypothetical protein